MSGSNSGALANKVVDQQDTAVGRANDTQSTWYPLPIELFQSNAAHAREQAAPTMVCTVRCAANRMPLVPILHWFVITNATQSHNTSAPSRATLCKVVNKLHMMFIASRQRLTQAREQRDKTTQH
jgi:hypothetical protein